MTGAASRSKGIRFERAVADYLGTVTTRSVRPGVHEDGGDVVLGGWLVECKDHGRLELGPWSDKANAARLVGQMAALVVKRRQRPVGDSFVVMTLATFREVIR